MALHTLKAEIVSFGDQCLSTRSRLFPLRTHVSTMNAEEVAALPRCSESLEVSSCDCPDCLLAKAPVYPPHGIQGIENMSVEKVKVHPGFLGLYRALCRQEEKPKLFLNQLAGN